MNAKLLEFFKNIEKYCDTEKLENLNTINLEQNTISLGFNNGTYFDYNI